MQATKSPPSVAFTHRQMSLASTATCGLTLCCAVLRCAPAAGDPEDIYRWSNTGPCIDIFAPGVDIFSACGGPSRCEVVDDHSYTYASGTSMAVPHVAGGCCGHGQRLAAAGWLLAVAVSGGMVLGGGPTHACA